MCHKWLETYLTAEEAPLRLDRNVREVVLQGWLPPADGNADYIPDNVHKPDMKNWLTGKDLDAGKDWRQEEKGTTEDEMVGWHHWLDGREFEKALGVGGGQGSLACCGPLGRKESDTTEGLNWTECLYRASQVAATGKEPSCECRRGKRHGFNPWRRKWQSISVFLPGKSHGQRSLEGYSSWGCKELDTTERLNWTDVNRQKSQYTIQGKDARGEEPM